MQKHVWVQSQGAGTILGKPCDMTFTGPHCGKQLAQLHILLQSPNLTNLELGKEWLEQGKDWSVIPPQLQVLGCLRQPRSFPAEFRTEPVEEHLPIRWRFHCGQRPCCPPESCPVFAAAVVDFRFWGQIPGGGVKLSLMHDMQLLQKRMTAGFALQELDVYATPAVQIPPSGCSLV